MADLDVLPTGDVVTAVLDAQERVLPAVRAAAPRIARAAELIADRMRAGGRLALVGAGTSGQLAVLQAAELPGTFGLARDRIIGRAAGGPTGTDADEDDAGAARRDAALLRLTGGDVLVAVAASGRTPYTGSNPRSAISRRGGRRSRSRCRSAPRCCAGRPASPPVRRRRSLSTH